MPPQRIGNVRPRKKRQARVGVAAQEIAESGGDRREVGPMRAGAEMDDLEPARPFEMLRRCRPHVPYGLQHPRLRSVDRSEDRVGDDDDVGGSLQEGPCPLGEGGELAAITRRQPRIGGAGLEVVIRDVDDLPDVLELQQFQVGARGVAAHHAGPADDVDVGRNAADGRSARTFLIAEVAKRIAEIEIRRGDPLEVLANLAGGRKDHYPFGRIRPSAPSTSGNALLGPP
jgi:hypothetical protein